MHLLIGRYSRSGYPSIWFIRALALAFVALTVWAVVRGDWLVFALALVMAVVTIIALPVARRLSKGLRASQAALDAERNVHRG